jgi:pimeloyl-ACP methyl ester carboxylesterase
MIRVPNALAARLLAAWCLFALTTFAHAQATSSVASVEGAGGWPIKFSYYPALEKLPNGTTQKLDEAPAVMLIHGKEGDRLFWDRTSAPTGGAGKPFAEVLQSQGYAVVAIDMRKHGDSAQEGQGDIVPADFEAMVIDLAAVKAFLMEQHQAKLLNIRKLGIIALDEMTPVAAAFAEADWRAIPYDDHAIATEKTPRGQDVRALVLVTPVGSTGRLQTIASVKFLANANLVAVVGNPALTPAVMLMAGKKDTEGMKIGRSLDKVNSTRTREDRAPFEQLDTNERSQHLFGDPRIKAEIPILQFLKTHVQDVTIPWSDRRSRRDRPRE